MTTHEWHFCHYLNGWRCKKCEWVVIRENPYPPYNGSCIIHEELPSPCKPDFSADDIAVLYGGAFWDMVLPAPDTMMIWMAGNSPPAQWYPKGRRAFAEMQERGHDA